MLAMSLLLVGAPPAATAAELPKAQDLAADARQVRGARMPIVLFFAAEDCTYCHIVEDDYLRPMFNSGRYRDTVLFRTVLIDDARELTDFQGNPVAPDVFAKRYGVSLTPQVKFLDANGEELVPGLIGLMTRDFYAGYLEDAISAAVAKLRPARK